MLGIDWDRVDERYFEHGLDRGVLYRTGADPVAWNGLTGFDEGGTTESSMYYRDGVIYLADVEPSDFSGKLTAMFFPDEFRECIGMAEPEPGFYVDNQKPRRFSFSYRTLIGSGMTGDRFGYQIHLVYNAVASIDPRSRETLAPDSEPMDFRFDLVCTPVRLPGYRPSAHYIIDTRNMPPAKLAELETILYGVAYGMGTDTIYEPIDEFFGGSEPGRLPTPTELRDIITAP